ncbi:MAG: GGDEF domain-containing protein [Lachnospiraceae bacterium]|nr:GGDEF domain-containing protein [Lachnospiraceae bacterium]
MSNFRHYIGELIKGNSFFGPKLIYRYSVISFAAIHILLGVLICLSDQFMLGLVTAIIGCLYFTVILPLAEKENYLLTLIICLAEVIILEFITTLFIGWDAGFYTYLFCSISASFYFTYITQNRNRHVMPLALSIMILLVYYIGYVVMKYLPPLVEYTGKRAAWINVFHVVNIFITFAVMVVFSYLFVWEIKSKNLALTAQNEQLDELANKDPLTHLYNRRIMNKLMEQRMELLKKTGKRFTMIIGDIDDFKRVNDTYGHDAGDLVLTTVASTILSSVRSEDFVCRWGGEEILVLVNDPLETAALAAERIRSKIENMVVSFDNQEIRVTMTFGITESIPGYRIEHLIQQADDKLYYGKKHGKNQVVVKLEDTPPQE